MWKQSTATFAFHPLWTSSAAEIWEDAKGVVDRVVTGSWCRGWMHIDGASECADRHDDVSQFRGFVSSAVGGSEEVWASAHEDGDNRTVSRASRGDAYSRSAC